METLKKFNIKSPSHLLGLFLVLFILLAIPLTVIQTLNSRDSRSQASSEGKFVDNEILIKFKETADNSQVEKVKKDIGAVEKINISKLGVKRWSIPAGQSLDRVLAKVKSNPNVSYAEPNYIATVDLQPHDDYFSSQWNMTKIRAYGAWDTTTGSETVTTAVLDTGIAFGHEDLEGRILPNGYDFVNRDNNASDDLGHGTHLAGIVGATGNNDKGVAGVDWKGKILPVKTCNSQGTCQASALAEGVVYAADNGARIINISVSAEGYSQTLQDAINYAHNLGVFLVASTGGRQQLGNPIAYPGGMNHVVAVSGTTSSDGILGSSGSGAWVDLAAPGGGIYSTFMPNTYNNGSGTSAAVPHVSGVAALLLAVKPSLTPDQIETILKETAVDIGAPGRDDFYGFGRIDSYLAVQRALNFNTGDNTPPSIVNGVRAISGVVEGPGVQVLWDPATDNVAVSGYHVYLNGSTDPLNTTAQSGNSYIHNTTNFTGTYTVKAKDTSQNLSIAFSSPAATVVACSKVDVDDTLAIDLSDTLAILAHFGESPSIPANYNPTYDIDTNPGIDLADALYSLKFFGKGCS